MECLFVHLGGIACLSNRLKCASYACGCCTLSKRALARRKNAMSCSLRFRTERMPASVKSPRPRARFTATKRGKRHGTFCATTSFQASSAKSQAALASSVNLYAAFVDTIWRRPALKRRCGIWKPRSAVSRSGKCWVARASALTAVSRSESSHRSIGFSPRSARN